MPGSKVISQKEYPSSQSRNRTAQHIPLGQLRMAFQAALDPLHGFFAQRNALLIDRAAQRHNRMDALPRHTLGPCQPGLAIVSLRPLPGQFHKTPTPFNGMVCAVRGRVLQPVDGVAHLVGTRHHAREQWRAHPAAGRAVGPFELHPIAPPWLRGPAPWPPRRQRRDDTIARLGGTPARHRQLRRLFGDDATGEILRLAPQVMRTGLRGPTGAPPAGARTAIDRRFPVPAHAFAPLRRLAPRVFFVRWSKMAAVAARFFGGLAVRTVRQRAPIRWTTAALVLGAGSWSSGTPWARRAPPAAWAVRRVYASVVRHVGACCAGASASWRRASAASGYCSSQRLRPLRMAPLNRPGPCGVPPAPPPRPDGSSPRASRRAVRCRDRIAASSPPETPVWWHPSS